MRNAAEKTEHSQASAADHEARHTKKAPGRAPPPDLADSPRGITKMAPIRVTALLLAGVWALAVATSYLGRYVHMLVIVAVALLLVEFVMERRARH